MRRSTWPRSFERAAAAPTILPPIVRGGPDMSFYTDTIKPHSKFASNERVADLDLLEPVTRAAVQKIIDGASSKGIALMVFETYRSQQRQDLLFQQKATQ